ncbi:hypothetical protein [Pseudomonas paralcaligenes]|uniref:hypothetical protein n=1 Tax=Pseudomonas paralcaligenes TaxID=2772558 RepID=UPI001C820DB6|nr:hypothetical protein [Pseudomonas paralcaligenes]
MSYFIETEIPLPNINGNGQGTECLRSDPIARQNRPPAVGVVDASNLANLVGTDLFQWYGRRSSGYWTPFGKVLRITPEGIQALRNELTSCKDYQTRYIQSLIKALDSVKPSAGGDHG